MQDRVKRKEWSEFQDNGLLVIVNQILHIFGWAIVFEYDKYTDITLVYPARVKFRGFSEKSQTDAYLKLSKYMVDNALELDDEIQVDAKRSTLNNMRVPTGIVSIEKEELKYPSLRGHGLTRVNDTTGEVTHTETLPDGRVVINDKETLK